MMRNNNSNSSERLYDYIEKNGLVYDAMEMIVFNKEDFLFIPLNKPSIEQATHNGLPHFAFGANGYNVLQSKYQFHTMMLDISKFKGGNQLLYHPEHLYGYISMYQNNITLEYYYERSSNGRMILIKAALLNFFDALEIDSIEKVLSYMKESKKRMQKTIMPIKKFSPPRVGDEDVIFCDEVIESYKKKNSINSMDRDKILFRKGISLAEKMFYSQLSITYNTSATFPGYDYENKTGKVKGIVAQTTNIPRVPIKTSLDSDISIVNKDDRISDILYNAALRIKATDYLIAVGYAYDSGLQLLTPAMMGARYSADTTEERDERRAELVVGSLQNYDGETTIKQMSRASAQRLNDLKKNICIKKLYTCPHAFYHGKFYYIASDAEAYVIMGSSNITKTAYEKNYEFDMIYHFVRPKEAISTLEKQFLDWYQELISNCVELDSLDEKLFPSSNVQDESGDNSKSSFYRLLESEEERERYSLLKEYNPSRISEYIFKGKAFKAFKKYILFEYAARGISILEGFSYGNSCYVLSVDREDFVKEIIAWKSKEQVKATDAFVTDIPHDMEYSRHLQELFENYGEDNTQD